MCLAAVAASGDAGCEGPSEHTRAFYPVCLLRSGRAGKTDTHTHDGKNRIRRKWKAFVATWQCTCNVRVIWIRVLQATKLSAIGFFVSSQILGSALLANEGRLSNGPCALCSIPRK